MSLVPRRTIELLQFAEQYSNQWRIVAANIGLTTDQVDDLAAALTDAKARFDSQQKGKDSLKAFTAAAKNAESGLRSEISDIVKAIRAYASNSADPEQVYLLAQIPSPARPSPRPAPGTPTDFRVSLAQDGAVTLRWKCDNRGTSGVVYSVSRRSGSAGAFTFVGVTGERSFTDDSIPASAGRVEYRVTAQRGTLSGEPAFFTVAFGGTGTGDAEDRTIAASFVSDGTRTNRKAA